MASFALVFAPRCSNSHPIGIFQHEFELQALRGLTPAEVATKMGFHKMCCRNAILNACVPYIYSADQRRVINEASVNNIQAESTPLIKLTRNPPEFPLLPGEIAPSANMGFPTFAAVPQVPVPLPIQQPQTIRFNR
jgi:DNA-directed RNA polymerase subunit N (RpoN/RPB10)